MMKLMPMIAACAAGFLMTSGAQALAPAPLDLSLRGPIEQAQYREWRGPGWDRPRYRPARPRVVCRLVPRRTVDRLGRVRVVRVEVCRRRW